MTLIFFQNCVSPHQIPYIQYCASKVGVSNVLVVAPRVDYDERVEMGWNSNELLEISYINFILSPTDEVVKSLFSEYKECKCMFSGIRADSDVFRWFGISLSYDVKRYIITESPYTYDKPLWMHYIRFYLLDYCFVKYIDGVFAIGEFCVKYYRSLSKRWKVFPFLYVTNMEIVQMEEVHGDLRIVYVGSLSKRKNVGILLESIIGVPSVQLSIYGDGSEREKLESFVRQKSLNVKFCGNIDMKEVQNEMSKHDVLVLPSLHDGWGAVVNEALTQGLYVVCSNKCGAMALLHDPMRGAIFKSGERRNLQQLMSQCSKNVEEIRAGRKARKQWAMEHISGEAVAHYFVACLTKDEVESLF